MIDIEKTLEDLEFLNVLCHGTVLDDVIALLKKELKAVKPTWQQGKAYCGSCGKRIPLKIGARFCHKCGKPILWEGR